MGSETPNADIVASGITDTVRDAGVIAGLAAAMYLLAAPHRDHQAPRRARAAEHE